MGPPRKPEPMNPDAEDRLKRALRDLVGEAREAARFLDGLAIGMSRVTDRLKAALDEDEIPF
jgi:hypothetical protein